MTTSFGTTDLLKVVCDDTRSKWSADSFAEIRKIFFANKFCVARKIMNYNNFSKEDLIYTLLRSEVNPYEYNYIGYTLNTPNNELKKQINLTRILINKLGDTLGKDERKDERKSIRKELHELENKRRFTKIQKEKALNYLKNLAKDLYKKEKYQYNDNYDLNYYGIDDMEHLFKSTSGTKYYKPILARTSFKNGYEEYEIRGDKDKNMSLQYYLYTIIPELTELIREKKLRTQNEQKVQLNMAIKFKDFTNPKKSYTIYIKSKVAMRQGDDTDNIIAKLLETFMENYEYKQNELRNGSNFVFDYVDWTVVKFHILELKRGSFYIPTPRWIANKNATINPNNKDNSCFQYRAIASLHHCEMANHLEQIYNLRRYINNYNWDGINFPTGSRDQDKFEKNNSNIAPNIFSATDTKRIYITRRSEYNNTHTAEVMLLMITSKKGNQHYLAIKNISRLLRGNGSNHHGDFICLNCFHSYRTAGSLRDHERLCYNHEHCKINMPSPGNNILQYNSGEKSLKLEHIITYDLEALLIKMIYA